MTPIKTTRFKMCLAGLLAIVTIFSSCAFAAATHEVLASFALPPAKPGYGALVLGPDGYYWGTTVEGGAYGKGTIYKVKADGAGWETVLSFSGNGASNKGSSPYSGLVDDGGGSLWGTTVGGGTRDYGTVFKVNVTTGVLTTIVNFTSYGPSNKGASPLAGLVSDGTGSFWGTTSGAATGSDGTVFKVNTTSGVLTTLVEFTGSGANNKGAMPYAGLVSDGSGSFWGTTTLGGAGYYGTVFKINATSGVMTTVVEFTRDGASNKGAEPTAGLVSDGSGNFWGTTTRGGTRSGGTIFKVNAASGVLTTVVEFDYLTNNGDFPAGGLASDGRGSFWGTTSGGAANGYGTVFRVDETSGTLTTVAEFGNGASNRGGRPSAGLVSDGNGSFWGTTSFGTVFTVNATSGVLTTVVDFAQSGASKKGWAPNAGLVSDESGNLWGTTASGGAGSAGTVFKINANSGVFTTVVELTRDKGANPNDGLVSDGNGSFWGTTAEGGFGSGTVFKVNAESGVLTNVVNFTRSITNNIGASPKAGLVSDGDGSLWGTTSEGGAFGSGTIFKVSTTSGVLATVAEFTGNGINNNGGPAARLVSDGNGSFWGTTYRGGRSNYGTIFKVNAMSGVLTTLVNFPYNEANNGFYPTSELVSDGSGNFWGTTNLGGTKFGGTVFKVTAVSGVLTTVLNFSQIGGGGRYPTTGLVSDGNGSLWGTTWLGGKTDHGTVFKVNAMSGVLKTLVEFSGTGTQAFSGGSPYQGALFKHSDGSLYGSTSGGGPGGGGTIFRITPYNAAPVATLVGSNPLTYEAAESYTDPGATALDDDDDGLTPTIRSNSVIPNVPGTYALTWGATDSGGLTGTATRTVRVVDRTAPVVGGTFSPLAMVEGTLPDFRPQATTTDAVGVVSLTQSPPPGTPTTAGKLAVTLTAKDAANNTGTFSFNVRVRLPQPVNKIHVAKSGAVPGAGTDGRIQNGAVWTGFGNPAINANGDVAFFGKWSAPKTATLPAQLGAGIFVDGTLLVKVGEAVAGMNGVTFKSLKDPVMTSNGEVAFLATLEGRGITSANDSAVMLYTQFAGVSEARVVAREGGWAPTRDGARWKSFRQLALGEGYATGLFIEGAATGADGLLVAGVSIDSLEDEPLLLDLVIRKGRTVTGALRTEKVTMWRFLSPVSGSPGQGRALAAPGVAPSFYAKLSSGRSVIVFAGDGGTAEVFIFTGDALGYGPQELAEWQKLGVIATSKNAFAMRATLASGVGGVRSANATGIFMYDWQEGYWSPVVRQSDPAPDMPSGATFSDFVEPVLAPDTASIAFAATAKGRGILAGQNQGIWWKPEGGTLRLVAREGAQPPGTPSGAKWKAFTSLALPGSDIGPIFTATTGNSGIGCWAVDSTGTLLSLFHEGGIVGGKTLKSFCVLKAVPSVSGSSRNFNAQRQLVWQATFTDGATAIVTTAVP